MRMSIWRLSLKKRKQSEIKQEGYKQGIKDSLRLLFTHISAVEHGAGFAASQKADDYLDIMKHVYSTMETLYND